MAGGALHWSIICRGAYRSFGSCSVVSAIPDQDLPHAEAFKTELEQRVYLLYDGRKPRGTTMAKGRILQKT